MAKLLETSHPKESMELFLFSIMMASGQLLFKASSLSLEQSKGQQIHGSLGAITEWRFLLALTLYGTATLVWMQILKKIPLTTAYPLATGATIALTFAAGTIIFKENSSPVQLAGAAMLVISLFLISHK